MSLLPLAFPPGIYRNGTEKQSQARWYDANLVRFYENTIRPIGGWRYKQRSGSLTDPFTTTVSTTVTVTHNTHGLRVGDSVTFTTGNSVGGLSMLGTWTVATAAANTYTFVHTGTGTAAGPLGGTVAYYYAQAASGKPRAILTWKDNSLVTYAGIGTHSKLYVMGRSGQLYDITPAGFTSGTSDAVYNGGYGKGAYGAGVYGLSPDAAAITDATVWSLDTWGQNLDGCTADDGKIYEWALVAATPAAQVTNSPTARAIVVTEERFLFALGAESVPRRVKWSDQEANTTWTPAATNQAGDFDLQTAGKCMMGRRVKGATLIWTDLDVHLAQYIGGTFIYSFNRIGESCGAISQNCAAAQDARAVWMGKSGFWLYNGFVQPLPCDVSDYVFADINRAQSSKVTCFINSQFGEVTWFYPSGSSMENDRYVTWNYRAFERGQVVWSIGALIRTAGSDAGTMLYPLLMGSDGFTYEHEVGFATDSVSPYLESGPIELGAGDKVMHATALIPDEKTSGDVTATFKTKFYPNGAEMSFGPYSLSSNTDVRFCGRQTKVRYTGARLADWRVGVPRLDVTAGGKR